MIAEAGHYALVLALGLALIQSFVPLLGARQGDPSLMNVARSTALVQLLFVAGSFAALVTLHVTSDFSVVNVFENSHSLKPLIYKITGVWGNHEGSMLLWVLILALFGGLVAAFGNNLPLRLRALVLSVQAWIASAFYLFILITSNPFLRIANPPIEGRDLNPVLQDIGLAVHPPMLYLGYVGFSISFSFAIAALIEGRIDAAWARWVRPWTLMAWIFLTLGIAMGSYWAYYELGWGGWWFWDPVENASLMPWLAGTALLHSALVMEKRNALKVWTILLSILTFSLSLLGTFLVRSGVLTSVHAFASDPRRGVFILAFLAIVVGGSLLLYALRAPKVAGGKPFNLVSRETALLIGNLMLATAAAMVLLGTLFPLIGDMLHLGRISVGPPYFGLLFPLLMAPIVLLLPFGPFLHWGKADGGVLKQVALRAGIAAAACAIVAAFFVQGQLKAIAGVAAAVWIAVGVLLYALKRWRDMPRGRRYPAEMAGMLLAHLGIAVFVVGVLLSESLSVTHDVRLAPGQSEAIAGYVYRFDGVHRVVGPNWHADQGVVTVQRDGRTVAVMHPQKRTYAREQVQTESAVDAGVFRDLYVALGEPMDANNVEGAWALRLYYKPFIRWIWGGGLLMMLGGFVCAGDRRFRIKRIAAEAAQPATASQPQGSPA